MSVRPIEILLAEDNPADARLTIEGFKDAAVKHNMTVVEDGQQVLDYLDVRRHDPEASLPDLILLDLNMPKKDGREVLAEIKADQKLKRIPVLVFTISSSEKDILDSYDLHANAFITKPIDLDEFITVIKSLEDFWLSVVKLPHNGGTGIQI